MDKNTFEIVKLFLEIIFLILSSFALPKLKLFLEENTTAKQRQEALFWTKYAVKIAEDLYKEKGQGKLKKEYVTEWLNKNGIKLTEEQLSVLIDMVVEQYNKTDWRIENDR